MSLDVIKLLRKSPIFSGLDTASLKKISVYLKEKSCSAGEVLFKEGTLGDKLYIIKEGAIRINKEAREGEEETSQVLRRVGEVFGEAGFLDEVPCSVTASADKPTKVLRLSRSNFLTILNQHPLIAYQIVKALSVRLKQTDLRIIDDLKEKNEHLQKANLRLLKKTKGTEDQEWSESKEAVEGESASVSDSLKSISEWLLSSLPFAVILTDKNDAITNVNPAAEKEFEWSGEDMTGKPAATLWDENSWTDISTGIRQRMHEKNFWYGQIIAKKQNGVSFVSSVVVSEIYSPTGENQGKLYLCWNSTESTSKEKEERLEELSSERQLTTAEIVGVFEKAVETLTDTFEAFPYELDEASLNHSMKTLSTMRNAINGLKEIIADFAFGSSFNDSKEPVDLVNLFTKELIVLKCLDKFHDISFTTHFEEGMFQIEGDKNQLRKLFNIILENSALAVQSTKGRKKSITIEMGSINRKQEVQIQILDNGIGINPANLPKLFKERFTTWKDGLGLGLLSAVRIVENHGGTISVESDPGSYTLIVIKFPVYQEKTSLNSEIESTIEIEQ